MKKLHKILCASLVSMFALGVSSAQAQITTKLPPWIDKKVPAPQPQPQPAPQTQPTVIIGGTNPQVIERLPDDRYYNSPRYRKGHPHGMPPGQAKKLGYRANPSNGGLPPGQAKKLYQYRDDDYRYDDHGGGKHHGKGHGKGH